MFKFFTSKSKGQRQKPLRAHKLLHAKSKVIPPNSYSSDEVSEDGSIYEPGSEDSSGDDNGDTVNGLLIDDAQTQLKEEGLNEYLQWHKPKRDATTVTSLVKRYARLVVWLFSNMGIWEALQVISVLYHLIMFESQTIEKYYHHLKTSLHFKPSTIYNANEELDEMMDWFCCFRKGRYTDPWAVRESDLHSLNVVIKKSRKRLARERKYEAAIDSSNTIAELIAANKWPPGGLSELHDAVLSQMDWARIVAKSFNQQQDKRIYKMFMELLLASLYTGNAY